MATVSQEKLSEIARAVDRELDSRRALNSGLQQLIAFTGVLLALAFAVGARIARHELTCAAKVLIAISLLRTLLSLLAIVLVALSGLKPQHRTTLNPETFRYYGEQGTKDSEVRSDIYDTEIQLLAELQEGNGLRARRQLLALSLLLLPLLFASGGAVTLFFQS